jgi:hypothetical protein
MGNILSLQSSEPIMTINNRRHYYQNGVEYVGPPQATANQKEQFSWNNLISGVSGGITSIFGFLTKNVENQGGQYYQQQQRNNNMLWIGIAVVAVIVIVVIFATRK